MIKKRLDSVIQKYCKDMKNAPDTYEGLNFIEDMEFDSVVLMELLVDVEEEFHIDFDISKDGIEIFSDYNTMLDCLRKRVREQ